MRPRSRATECRQEERIAAWRAFDAMRQLWMMFECCVPFWGLKILEVWGWRSILRWKVFFKRVAFCDFYLGILQSSLSERGGNWDCSRGNWDGGEWGMEGIGRYSHIYGILFIQVGGKGYKGMVKIDSPSTVAWKAGIPSRSKEKLEWLKLYLKFS